MKLHTLPCLALSLLLLAGCTAQAEPVEATFFAMDTVMTLQVYGADQALLDQLREEVLRLEGLWSVTDENSEIYAADHAGGQPVTVSEDTADLLSQALAIGRATGGALSLTIYPVVRSWGFTTGEYRVPGQQELDALLPLLRSRRLWGAALDVTEPEPLPPGHPLWAEPGALITPHVAGGFYLAGTLDRVIEIALDNLGRYLAGQPLKNRKK